MTSLEGIEERRQDSCPARTDRVTERNRASMDIDLGGIGPQFTNYRHGLSRERLVELDQVDVIQFPTPPYPTVS